jgi:hypothetical protein
MKFRTEPSCHGSTGHISYFKPDLRGAVLAWGSLSNFCDLIKVDRRSIQASSIAASASIGTAELVENTRLR